MTSVRVERSGPGGVVARVTLDRPGARNAFDDALAQELHAAFAALAQEPADRLRAVVLAGAGRVFCAGADIATMRASAQAGRADNVRQAERMADLFDAIDRCPVPVVARIQGAALGGGAGLCAVSDLVIAEAEAVFGFTEARLGIIPAVIAPFVLARIGEGEARALFPFASRFDAARALRVGLVHQVVATERALDATVDAAVDDLLAVGPEAAREAKRTIHDLRGLAPADARRLTTVRLADVRAGEEAQEGLRAFLERRPPAWVTPEG